MPLLKYFKTTQNASYTLIFQNGTKKIKSKIDHQGRVSVETAKYI